MKKSYLSICILFLSGIVYGQETSLLWRIEKDGVFEGYLFGTYHSSGTFANSDSTFLFERMQECRIFAPEIDFTQVDELGEELTAIMFYPEGLSSLYTEDEWVVIDAYFEKELGPMRASLYLFKPFWAMVMEENIRKMKEPSEGGVDDITLILDVMLATESAKQGMQMRPLETAMEQMEAVESIPLEDQAQDLLQSITDTEWSDPTELLQNCYQAHDLDCLVETYEKYSLSTSAEEALIGIRNKVMGERLMHLLETEEPVFCAVGALHLPRYLGLLDQLDVAGYTLTPIKY